jgi:hypothetical protein
MLFSRHQTERTPRQRRRRLAILAVAFAALAGPPAVGVITASAAEAAPAITLHASMSPQTAQESNATPAIQEGACTHATWVHVDSTDGLECFAHPGTWHFGPAPELFTFCSGNNSGSFTTYSVSTGKDTTKKFSAGYRASFASGIYIETLTLTSGSGSDSC